MISEHAAAFMALLDADAALNPFDGQPPDETTPPYVVVWVSVDNEETVSLCADPSMPNLRFTTHSVGSSGSTARSVADRVRAAVLGKRMTVPGWRPFKIQHEYGVPPQWNESTGYRRVDVVDVWTASAVPD